MSNEKILFFLCITLVVVFVFIIHCIEVKHRKEVKMLKYERDTWEEWYNNKNTFLQHYTDAALSRIKELEEQLKNNQWQQ